MNSKRKISLIITIALLLLSFSTHSWAQRFWKIGTRALGMGGAYVAAADDSLSAYWNPAGVSFFQRYDLSYSYGILAQQEGKPINEINDLIELGIDLSKDSFDEAALSSAVGLLESLSQQGVNINGQMQMGFFSTGGAWGASLLEWKASLIKPVADLVNIDSDIISPHSIKNNNSHLDIQGIKAREYIFSLSYPLFVSQLMLGVNIKYMQLKKYENTLPLFNGFDESVSARNLIKDSFQNNIASGGAFSFDIGLLAELSQYVRVGLVGKNFRSPTFELDNEEELQLKAQWRTGVAVVPNPATIISVDFDLTKSKWFENDDLEFRELAAGFERWLFNYRVAIRGGGYYNFAAEERDLVYTAGGSVRMQTFYIDIAIAYQPHLNDLSFCFGASVKF
jgi:hypothetical protein